MITLWFKVGNGEHALSFPDDCTIQIGRAHAATGRVANHLVTCTETTRTERTSPRNFDVTLDVDELSRNHARITVRGGHVTIQDLGSTNGTFVEIPSGLPYPLEQTVKLGGRVVIRGGMSVWFVPPSLREVGVDTIDQLLAYIRRKLQDYEKNCPVRITTGRLADMGNSSQTVVPILGTNSHVLIGHEGNTVSLAAVAWIRRLVEVFSRESEDWAEPLRSFVANSEGRRRAKEQARMAALSDVAVLLVGPSGTGKDLLAQGIHHHSRRSDKPFVEVGCPGIPPSLFEAALFGHVRGAFAEAYRDAPGHVQIAEGGTLFLNEVGFLPPELQVKLLTFLNKRRANGAGERGYPYYRVGSPDERFAHIRIMAATSKPAGLIPDLYHRLAQWLVEVPSIDQEDVGALVPQLATAAAEEQGASLPDEEMDSLIQVATQRKWDGNVRQLEHTLTRYIAHRNTGRSFEEAWQLSLPAGGTSALPKAAATAPSEPIDGLVDLHRVIKTTLLDLARLAIARQSRTIHDLGARFDLTDEGTRRWMGRIGVGKEDLGGSDRLDEKIAERRSELATIRGALNELLGSR